MKCLLVLDIHYALKQFDWTSSVAADFDVVIIAGDHMRDMGVPTDGDSVVIGDTLFTIPDDASFSARRHMAQIMNT